MSDARVTVGQMLGALDAKQIFKQTWGKMMDKELFSTRDKAKMGPSIKQLVKMEGFKEASKDQARKAVHLAKAMSMSDVTTATPIIFDPEILGLLNDATPFLNAIDKEPYQGYTVRSNNISARDDPVGAISEATSRDLSSYSKDFTIGPVSADMKIFADVAETTDFGQAGTAHYMNFRETNLGQRVAAHLRSMERHLLYGNPAKAGAGGDPYDTNAFEGIANICEDAGTSIDKAAVSSDFLQDIADVIADMLQSGNNILPSDLSIWVSQTMMEALKADARTGYYGQINVQDGGTIDFNYAALRISGVPVIAGDQIREHTFAIAGPGTEAEGSAGDVFIVNKLASKMRYLAPMSIIPLARIGLAERVALFEFSTFIDRADGLFNRYLYNYAL